MRPGTAASRDGLDVGVGVLGAPVGVLHDEPAGVPELLVPHPKGGAEGGPVVSGSRLDVDLLERRVRPDFPVRDAVHAAPAGKAEFAHPGPPVEAAQDVERGLLVDDLERVGEVLMVRRELLVGVAGGAEQIGHRVRVDAAERGVALVPLHLDAVGPVAEVVEVELERAARHQIHQLADLLDARGLPVWREPHHLELVAVVEEPEVLRDGRVEHPERVREVRPVDDVEVAAPPLRERRRDEVAEPVNGRDGGLVERRAEKGAGEVGGVVLDVVDRRERRPREPERLGERPLDLADGPLVAEPVEDELQRRPLLQREERLLREVRLRIAADGDVGDLRAGDPGHL